MAEPTTATTTSTALISAYSITTLFPNLDASVVLGALCGATLLIVGKNEFGRFKSILLFFVSFLIGIQFADFMMVLLPLDLAAKTPRGFGALLVSILITQLLLLLLKQDLASLIKIIRGKV